MKRIFRKIRVSSRPIVREFVFPLGILLFILLNLLYIDQQVRFVAIGDDISSTKRKLDIVRSENTELKMKIAHLMEPARIERIAYARGMNYPSPQQQITLYWDPKSYPLERKGFIREAIVAIQTRMEHLIIADMENRWRTKRGM